MQKILKRDHGFDLHFESSERYVEWADTDPRPPVGAVRVEVRPGHWASVVLNRQRPK